MIQLILLNCTKHEDFIKCLPYGKLFSLKKTRLFLSVHVKICILIWYFSYVSHTKWTKIVIPKSFLDYFKRGETYKIKVPGLVCCSWQPPIYYLWRISGAYMLNCCLRDKSSAKDDKIYVYDRNITRQSLSIFSKCLYLVYIFREQLS